MRIWFVFVTILTFIPRPALACDLKNLLFGTSASHVIDQYGLKSLEMDIDEMPKKGEFTLKEFGRVACKNMPDESFIEFTLIDDAFVKVKIENNSPSQDLLRTLKGIFGESDDKDREKSPDGKTKVAMWDVGKKMSVLYILGEDSRGNTIESADISSKVHHPLFQDVVEQKNKEINKYLEKNNLGKYSSSYRGTQNFKPENSDIGNNSSDPESLKK